MITRALLIFLFTITFILLNSIFDNVVAKTKKIQPAIYETIRIDSIFDNEELVVRVDTSRIQVLSKEFKDGILEATVSVDLATLNDNFLEDIKGNNSKVGSIEAVVEIRFINGKILEVINWKSVRKKIILSAKETFFALKEDIPEMRELAYLTYMETLNNLNTHDDVKKVVYSKLEFLLLPYSFENSNSDTLILEDSIVNVFDKQNKIFVQTTHVNRIYPSENESEISSMYNYDTDKFNSMIHKIFGRYFPSNEISEYIYFIETNHSQKIRYFNENLNPFDVVRTIKVELNFPRIGYSKKISTIRTYPI